MYLLYLPIHGGSIVFPHRFLHRKHLRPKLFSAKGDFYQVSGLYVTGRLSRPAVDGNAASITGLLRHGTPLNQPGYLEPIYPAASEILAQPLSRSSGIGGVGDGETDVFTLAETIQPAQKFLHGLVR